MLAPERSSQAGAGWSRRSTRARAARLRPRSCRAGAAASTRCGRARTGRSCSSGGRTARCASTSSRPAGGSPGYGPARLSGTRSSRRTESSSSPATPTASSSAGTFVAALGSREPSTALPIRDLAVSSDGKLVASAAGEAARVWLATDGSQVARLPHPALRRARLLQPFRRPSFSTVARDARLYDARDWGRRPARARPAG